MERNTDYRAEPRGWGVAALICALAIACAVGAGIIHERTYMHPTHPLAGVPSAGAAQAGH
jgi:hypothetical protein